MKKIHYFFISLLAVLGIGATVYGNASYFAPIAQSATATSSVQYLRVNTSAATSTPLIYDSFGIDGTNETAGQKFDATDSVALEIYMTASSTSTVLLTNIEYSDGVPGVSCVSTPTACDWYQNNLDTYAAGSIAIATPNSYTWTYASTTVGGAAVLATTSTGTKLIGLKVPTRYVRAIFSVSGTNAAVWGKFIPKKQQQ